MGPCKISVTIESQGQKRSPHFADRTMWVLLIATLSSCITMVTARAYNFRPEKHCYQCHAGPDAPINDHCRSFSNQSSQPTMLPCTHNCYIRYDTSGAVSRGCFHTTFATEEGEVRCQSISSSVYCFCDSHRCNNKSLYELAPAQTFHSELTFTQTPRSNGATSKVIGDISHPSVAPTSESSTPKGPKGAKGPTRIVSKSKWFKRRHDHGISKKQDQYPYAFQSMFRNNYVY